MALQLTWCSCLVCRARVAASRLGVHRRYRCAAQTPEPGPETASAIGAEAHEPTLEEREQCLLAEREAIYRKEWRAQSDRDRLKHIAQELSELDHQRRVRRARRNGVAVYGPALTEVIL